MKRYMFVLLTLALSTLTTASFAANADNNVSPAERAKIEGVVHDYLLKKPEVIVEVLQILQKKQFEQAEQTVKQTQRSAATFAKPLFSQASDPVGGNPNGKITVVEFFDYQCPHCVDMAPVMESVLKTNPDVRVVYKEFPVRGPISEMAAKAALAANKQGKYKEFSHALLIAPQPLTEEAIFQIAGKVGLDVTKLKQDMNSDSINNQIKANVKLAQDLKLLGTPAFFIGKTTGSDSTISYTPGQMNQGQLQAAIEKASK